MEYVRILTVGSLIMVLGACAPNVVTYFRPAVEGGQIVTGNCVPTESRAEFSVNNLLISAVANTSKKGINVSLFLNPIPDQTVYFDSDYFQVHDTEKGIRNIEISISTHRRDDVKTPSIPYPANGSKVSPLRFTNFNIHIYFPNKDIESFELVSPPIIINDIKSEFPVIRFQRKTWAGVSPINC